MGIARREAGLRVNRNDGAKRREALMHQCFCTVKGVGPGRRIECVLRCARELNSTDVRDRIFRLLELSDAVTETGPTPQRSDLAPSGSLQIDYTYSATRVFQDVTKYILNRDQCLRILYLHVPVTGARNDLQLPSWTPDWRDPPLHCRASAATLDSDDEYYRIQNFGRPLFNLDWQSNTLDGVMLLQGAVLGSVSAVRDVIRHPHRGDVEARRLVIRLFANDNFQAVFSQGQCLLQGLTYGFAQHGDMMTFVKGSILPILLRQHMGNSALYSYVGCVFDPAILQK